MLNDKDNSDERVPTLEHQEVNGAYRMVDMLMIIAHEMDVSSEMISGINDTYNSWDQSASGTPQQLVNGLYRSVELAYMIGSKSDAYGSWSSYFQEVYDNWIDINKSCEGAPQQAANGIYRFVEMLGGWAMTL